MRYLSGGNAGTNQQAGAVPEWAGWLALAALVLGFGLLAWWLFFSPLPRPVQPRPPSTRALRARRLLAIVMLLTSGLGMVGARWDELWHRLYGGFGEDFLWPPHLLLYVSLGMNGVFAVLGLALALRGRGGLRERFRAEPLMGLLGLLAAYQIASIPSDLLWHEIIGPDISAWSLPHVILGLSISAVHLTGVAIALSTVDDRSWRALVRRPDPMELVVVGLVAVSTLNLLQLGTTEWEWLGGDGAANSVALHRPVWSYPLVTLVIGIASSHVALYGTRRTGAASAVALTVLLVHATTLLFYRAAMLEPVLAAHVLLVPPAIALDTWCALRRSQARPEAAHRGGALLYSGVFFAVALPYIARLRLVPALNMDGQITTIAIGVPVALIAGIVFARIATWLGHLGEVPAEEPAPRGAAAGARSV